MENKLNKTKIIILSIAILTAILSLSVGIIGIIQDYKEVKKGEGATATTFYLGDKSYTLYRSLIDGGRTYYYYEDAGCTKTALYYYRSSNVYYVSTAKGFYYVANATQSGSTYDINLKANITIAADSGFKGLGNFANLYTNEIIYNGYEIINNTNYPLICHDMIITTALELKNFASMVNSGTDFAGSTVKLANDITFSTTETFTPIGTPSNPFKGTFDGGGNKISNIKLGCYQEQSKYIVMDRSAYPMYRRSYGLFAYTENATITDIHIDSFNITASLNSLNELYSGLLVGNANGNLSINNCVINSCTITETGKVFDNSTWYNYVDKIELYSGILVGKVQGTFSSKNCMVKNSSIKLTNNDSVTKHNYVGGMVGFANSCNVSVNSILCDITVNRISNGADLTPGPYMGLYCKKKSNYYVGGLIGKTSTVSTISSNYFIGKIEIKSEYVLYYGGIAGSCGANSTVNKNYVQLDSISIDNRHFFEAGNQSVVGTAYKGVASSNVNIISNLGSTSNLYYLANKSMSLAYDTGSSFFNPGEIYEYVKSDFTSYTGASSTDKWK